MKKIMFVCHGNICRSPTAEFVFKDMIKKQGLEGEFYVASSATSTEELGHSVYPPSAEEMRAHGISCAEKRAVQLTLSDYDKYDLFVGMDGANVRNMHRMLNGDPDGKIRKLMDYTPKGGDVSDPWYSRRFDIAYNDIYDGCAGLLKSLLND